MKAPTLRHPRLCRILTYVVVLAPLCVGVPLFCLLPVPDWLKAVAFLAVAISTVAYMGLNFPVLMFMDIALGTVACQISTRERYPLPAGQSADAIESSLARFGMGCDPLPLKPRPEVLRYRLCHSWTVYARGIETVVMTYRTDTLTMDRYRSILSSARANARAVQGRKRPRFLDSQQKNAKLHRAVAVLIFTNRVDTTLDIGLHEQVCKQTGDEFEDSFLPCVVDFGRGQCCFDAAKLPYVGFGIAAKNRAIRLIRRFVFNGRLPAGDGSSWTIPDCGPDTTLWELWSSLSREFRGVGTEIKKTLSRMVDRQIRMDDRLLYLRWGERGLTIPAIRKENRLYLTETFDWEYPNERPMAKKTRTEIRAYLTAHFAKQGITAEFLDEQIFSEMED